jgi:hypothetical protein
MLPANSQTQVEKMGFFTKLGDARKEYLGAGLK